MPDKPNTQNVDNENNHSQEPRPLIGRDMSTRDSETVTINLDKHDQRDDVKRTTWH